MRSFPYAPYEVPASWHHCAKLYGAYLVRLRIGRNGYVGGCYYGAGKPLFILTYHHDSDRFAGTLRNICGTWTFRADNRSDAIEKAMDHLAFLAPPTGLKTPE